MVPQRGTETFISTIGHIDGRIELFKGKSTGEEVNGPVSGDTRLEVELGNRALMDLCIMASKLAYENAKVIKNVVLNHWKASKFLIFFFFWGVVGRIQLSLLFQTVIFLVELSNTDAFCGLLRLLEW